MEIIHELNRNLIETIKYSPNSKPELDFCIFAVQDKSLQCSSTVINDLYNPIKFAFNYKNCTKKTHIFARARPTH